MTNLLLFYIFNHRRFQSSTLLSLILLDVIFILSFQLGWNSPPEVFGIAIVQIFAMLSLLRQTPCPRTSLSLNPSWPLSARKHFKRDDNLKEVFFFHKNLTSIIKQAYVVHHNQKLPRTTKLPPKRANHGIINQFQGISSPAILWPFRSLKIFNHPPTIGCKIHLWLIHFPAKSTKSS